MKDYWLETYYPTTIVADRYTGAYSGGIFTCWPLDYWDLPNEIEGGDTECELFWFHYDKSQVGIGNTPQEAFEDLVKKKGNEK